MGRSHAGSEDWEQDLPKHWGITGLRAQSKAVRVPHTYMQVRSLTVGSVMEKGVVSERWGNVAAIVSRGVVGVDGVLQA